MRADAVAIQLARHSWVAGLLVPVLPDPAGDEEVEADLRRAYRTLAEAVARVGVGDCAVQVRLESSGADPARPGGLEGVGQVVCRMLLRARSEQECSELLQLARTTLATRLPTVPLDDAELVAALPGPFADPATVHRCEVRRVVDDAGPWSGSPTAAPDLPAVVRWAPDAEGLRQAASLLATRRGASQVVLHMEPWRVSTDLLDHLDALVRDVAVEQDVASSPLRTQVILQYRARMRDLPRAALQVRVVVSTADRPSPALEAATGIALTEGGGFRVVVPSSDRESEALTDLVERLDAGRPRPTSAGGTVLAELTVVADAAEAAAVVRFPVPAPAGTVGLASAPVAALPRAAEPAGAAGRGVPLMIGAGAGGGTVSLGLDELRQHLLVAGLPGFGKSLTTQTLLAGVHEQGVPFLVIDPAKGDYRHLAAVVPDLRVVQLTPDDLAFNPFGVPEGCDRVTHAGRVLAAFDAAFSLSRQWPVGYVTLARALYRAYDEDEVPTLASLERHLRVVLAGSGFQGPDGANIRASLLGRIDFLARGPFGAALAAPALAVTDHVTLMGTPTVVELRRFAGPTERSLLFALLLAGVISYRENNPVHEGLGHVTVLEEAHRLLRRDGEGPASEGVRTFIEAIAELRGSGEGIVVVDQAPTLLDPGVMKLAGSLLTHRLVDEAERTTVGAAMVLDERQSRDLARLAVGEVVVHSPHRQGSVVARVSAPAALLAADRSLHASSQVLTRLPWRAADGPDPGDATTSGGWSSRLRAADDWLKAYTELAGDLAATPHDALRWRRSLHEIEHAIRSEVARRTKDPR